MHVVRARRMSGDVRCSNVVDLRDAGRMRLGCGMSKHRPPAAKAAAAAAAAQSDCVCHVPQTPHCLCPAAAD